MLIDVYGLLPWSRTAAYRPRPRFIRRKYSFLGRQDFVLLLLIAIFPVMVYSIEPVPSSQWSLAIDPSYVLPSTSTDDEQVERGSGAEETTALAPTASSGYYAWYAGRKSQRTHNVSSSDQVQQRRRNRIKGHDRQGVTEEAADDNAETSEDEDANTKVLPDSPPAAAVVRWYRLYNRCSGGYMQMYMNNVNARGKSASPLAQLRVVIDSYGSRIRIQSQKFGKYLCFNRRQRITSKYNGRSERCVFIEKISDNHYTELESAWRPGLYLGFNRGDGKFLDPSRYYTDRRTCFQFIKTSNASDVDAFNTGGSQQQQSDGPTDFSRLSPEGQRWLRARMHQEIEGSGDGEVVDFEERRNRGRHQHRLRHERTRLRHHRHDHKRINEH